jgi:hypothetical protein
MFSGTTRPQVLKAIGWKGISFQVVAKNAGLKLKVDETKTPFVYRTVQPCSTSSTPSA